MEIKKVVNANQTYLYDFILSKDNLDFKIFFGGVISTTTISKSYANFSGKWIITFNLFNKGDFKTGNQEKKLQVN